MAHSPLKLVYLTPALYMAGGVERVLTLKANYFAEHFGYDITIVLTEGKDSPLFYPLSDKIKVINLDINFEELWTCSFAKKIFVYLKKQRQYKQKLSAILMDIRPDITISLLRREINFINVIPDGSRKIGELHVNRANYRNFEANESNLVKNLFAKFWMQSLVVKLKKLDQFVVLTEEDRLAWPELKNICVIPDPLPFTPSQVSSLTEKRVIAVARYSHEKGIDLLLQAWAKVEQQCSDWRLDVFGNGDSSSFESLINQLGIDRSRCKLNGCTDDVEKEYLKSSLFVLSSRFEGFGMVIVEAMACGLPVISFDCPCGPRAIITNGKDGLLVDNGNVTALAQKIITLISDVDRCKDLAVAASNTAQRFTMSHIASEWVELFEDLR